MTRNEQKAKRPEGWDEVVMSLQKGELTQEQACERLGISRAWLNRLLHRDNPGHYDRRKEWGKTLGKSNVRYTTYLEKHFRDSDLCKMIRVTENCGKCPIGCNGQKKYRGLGKKLVERVLKAQSDISEDT